MEQTKTVYVEFYIENHLYSSFLTTLQEYGFVLISTSVNESDNNDHWVYISGTLHEESVTLIKLANEELSYRMSVKYIPESIKERYRNR